MFCTQPQKMCSDMTKEEEKDSTRRFTWLRNPRVFSISFCTSFTGERNERPLYFIEGTKERGKYKGC